jgi:nicotinate dehydrogenase subunit A
MIPAAIFRGGEMPRYQLHINGRPASVEAQDPAQPLLYSLRNDLGLTGAKFGCGLGQCGACSVLIDGRVARSCMTAVSTLAGKKITTIEGLGTPEKPHPVQAAFIAEQAAQCGYCTNGMVMATAALLAANPKPTLEQAKAALDANLCKCGSHHRVMRAVMRASGRGRA